MGLVRTHGEVLDHWPLRFFFFPQASEVSFIEVWVKVEGLRLEGSGVGAPLA